MEPYYLDEKNQWNRNKNKQQFIEGNGREQIAVHLGTDVMGSSSPFQLETDLMYSTLQTDPLHWSNDGKNHNIFNSNIGKNYMISATV